MSLTLKFLTLFGIIVLLSGAIKAEDDVNDVDDVDYDETDSYDAPESESISSRSYGLNVELGGKQYYVGSNRKANWYKAAQICATRNMGLTAIESAAEFNNLYYYLFVNSLLSEQFWLSGSDLAEAGRFAWLATGNKLNYTNWSTTPPQSGCVLTDVSTFKWNTDTCISAEHYFICSRPTMPYCGANGRCIFAYNY